MTFIFTISVFPVPRMLLEQIYADNSFLFWGYICKFVSVKYNMPENICCNTQSNNFDNLFFSRINGKCFLDLNSQSNFKLSVFSDKSENFDENGDAKDCVESHSNCSNAENIISLKGDNILTCISLVLFFKIQGIFLFRACSNALQTMPS